MLAKRISVNEMLAKANTYAIEGTIAMPFRTSCRVERGKSLRKGLGQPFLSSGGKFWVRKRALFKAGKGFGKIFLKKVY